eukprot:Nk52_evm69s164 gene=Nk52_evmTU69s164
MSLCSCSCFSGLLGGGKRKYSTGSGSSFAEYSRQELLTDVEFEDFADEEPSGVEMPQQPRQGSAWGTSNAQELSSEEIQRITEDRIKQVIEEERRRDEEMKIQFEAEEERLRLEEERILEEGRRKAILKMKDVEKNEVGGTKDAQEASNLEGNTSAADIDTEYVKDWLTNDKLDISEMSIPDDMQFSDNEDDENFDEFLDNVKTSLSPRATEAERRESNISRHTDNGDLSESPEYSETDGGSSVYGTPMS